MKATNNAAIDQFIIDVTLIEPVTKIICQLENRKFRDCDIKWLDSKLENFTKLACQTLDLNILVPSQIGAQPYPTLNDYNRDKYLRHFNTLLNYFKGFN